MMELEADPKRVASDEGTSYHTGIYVRARLNGVEGSYDILHLTLPSLKAWLQSRGGDSWWAEVTVAILLGWSMQEIQKEWDL